MMGGGRGRGGEGSGSLNQWAHLRGGVRSTSSRLREDLQAVVRSSLTPLMEPVQPPSSLASHLSSLLPTPASSSAPPLWAPPTSTLASTSAPVGTTWQESITVTIQQQPHHVLDIE